MTTAFSPESQGTPPWILATSKIGCAPEDPVPHLGPSQNPGAPVACSIGVRPQRVPLTGHSHPFKYVLDIAYGFRLTSVLEAACNRPRGAVGMRMTSDVFASERQDQIARIVEEHGRARVADLARLFRVSGVTIRKDLVALDSAGRVQRAHGGAIVAERSRPERAFEVRERLQRGEKTLIGEAAAQLVHDGESIALDASTTALYFARALKARDGWSQLTVITNGLRIASELAGYPGITVAMPGGWVRWEALSLVGELGDAAFDRVNIQTAFVGASGFTVEAGLSDATEEEAHIKRSMITAASEIVAIVDYTKWGRRAFATFCPIARITRVVTDVRAPSAMVDELGIRGIDTRLVAVDPAATTREDTTRKRSPIRRNPSA